MMSKSMIVIIVIVVVLAIAAAIAFVIVRGVGRIIAAATAPNMRELCPEPDVQFLGGLSESDVPGVPTAAYFSVRIGDRTSAIGTDSPFGFKPGGTVYPFASLSIDDVRSMGGKIVTEERDYGPAVHHGFFGWGAQNRVGAVEFNFADGRLTELYARWHDATGSPFAIVAPNGVEIRFPCGDDELIEAFGVRPFSVRDVRWY